jgi:hypothetical protein
MTSPGGHKAPLPALATRAEAHAPPCADHTGIRAEAMEHGQGPTGV